MIFYLFDFFVNNLNLFVCATILFRVGRYDKRSLVFLLFIDIFINKIPVIFISIFLLNWLNQYIRRKFVNSYVLDNLLFLGNYFLFFTIIFLFRNKEFVMVELLQFYWNNFLINYILFLLISKTNVWHNNFE